MHFSPKMPAVLLCVVSLSLLTSASAQSTNASLSGQVTDVQGLVVVGAEVEVVNQATNVVYSTKTNGEGFYSLSDLPPGTYEVHILKDGFRTLLRPGIELHVQDARSLNATLQVGDKAEIVRVEGGISLINTESAAVSTVVDRQFAENLPLNGRSFQTLIELTPGVVITGTNAADNGQFSVNGQRAASNYWMVDGVGANIGVGGAFANPANGLAGAVGSFSAAGGTNSLVSVDAMQEFRIQTSTYAPEFGRTPGAQISIVTRSGTGQFHGTAFDYLRNDVLDANDWFADSKGLKKPEERQNDFGGTLSGPIKKDETFFFFSYEGLRLRLPQTGLTTVPCDGSCAVFGNARTAAAAGIQPFFNAYPLPNGPEVFTPCTPNVNGCPSSGEQTTGTAQFNASYSNPSTLDAYSLRIDQKLKSKLNLFGRYNYSPSELSQRGAGGALSVVKSTRITTQTGTVGATWAISSGVANDLRFNYSRTNAEGGASVGSFGGSAPLTSLPFPNSFTIANAQLVGFNTFSLKSGTLTAGPTIRNLQRQINAVDGLSVQRGTHGLKFGVDFRRLSPQFEQAEYAQLALFLNIPSAENGNVLAAGVFSNLVPTFLFRNLGVYAQDTWRIAPRLTVTYGLRWDVDFVPKSLDGPSLNSVTGFNLNDLSSLALAPAGSAPYKTTYDNFAPRIGIAYQLGTTQDRQTVLRGGFGVFYDLATSEIGNNLGVDTYPFGAQRVCLSFFQLPGCPNNLSFPLDPATAAPPAITPPTPANRQFFNAFDPNLVLPYTLGWNFAVEQGLGRRQTISASYVGAAGRRLLQTAQLTGFSGNPNFSSANLVTNAGTSDYNALQVQFQRRLSRGLQGLASYTWSHSIDTGSAGSTVVSSNDLVPGAVNANRGPSDFDIRNAFSAALTYDIPAPGSNTLAKTMLRGWSLQSLILARSAPPVTVFQDVINGNSVSAINGFSAFFRPDRVPGIPFYLFGPQYPGGKAINNTTGATTCPDGSPSVGPFCPPPVDPKTGLPTRNGNLGRNALRGFGATQWDFGVHRDFPIREALNLQFRAELFNVLNHPNFGQPDGFISDPQFGLATQTLGQYLGGGFTSQGSGGFNPLYQIGGPRSVQFALKLMF